MSLARSFMTWDARACMVASARCAGCVDACPSYGCGSRRFSGPPRGCIVRLRRSLIRRRPEFDVSPGAKGRPTGAPE
ncbi:hypothetical protein HMPREF0762_01361 [Slackia exigua ATCC 700122]|uniref:4Fe-4S ferredoxin-type domain-containing protein n=1 Tax=Slackia exigua (strain ATCC 700122 / DSM 15923 / CIP 105133 / JCM 11022 / KCTC 5966 / S-7) TaxID=649764 RepID=D0WHP3_SLAES|nr:hypothetical protein HMPREF0762_01361 [Slackia exigua ATCC 700122]